MVYNLTNSAAAQIVDKGYTTKKTFTQLGGCDILYVISVRVTSFLNFYETDVHSL